MTLRPLPSRPVPEEDEAMDSFIERLAAANGCRIAPFTKMLSHHAGVRLRFINIAPHPAILQVLTAWVAVDISLLRSQLLTRYPIVPAIDHNNLHGTRSLVSDGWIMLNRSQACSTCLREGRGWKTQWRLAWTTACLEHQCLLVTDCPGCHQPLRTAHHGELKSGSTVSRCGNPRAKGPGQQCPFDLGQIPPRPVSRVVISQQHRVDRALRGQDIHVAGQAMPGQLYLRFIQTLTVPTLCQNEVPATFPPVTDAGFSPRLPHGLRPAQPAPRPAELRAAASIRIDSTIALRQLDAR